MISYFICVGHEKRAFIRYRNLLKTNAYHASLMHYYHPTKLIQLTCDMNQNSIAALKKQ